MSSGRRAPVQASWRFNRVSGSVSWEEHVEAWMAYAKVFGKSQSAERIAERAGFCYGELVDFLGREPTTWEPV